MRSTPKIDADLRARLSAAVDKYASGSADAFGRMLGYANGGYIRECLKEPGATGYKPVRDAIISRVNDHELLRGLFDDLLPRVTVGDVAGKAKLSPDALRVAAAYERAGPEVRAAFDALAQSFPAPQLGGDRNIRSDPEQPHPRAA